jgi:hypothetical protein
MTSTRGTEAIRAGAIALVMIGVTVMPKAESAAGGPERISAMVTIAGCLERDRETFRLKDASGVNGPTSRTWKFAFLKKGPATIEVVDGANRLQLSDHVGRRVNLTGVLVDREMQVRSLQRVASSCNKNSTIAGADSDRAARPARSSRGLQS